MEGMELQPQGQQTKGLTVAQPLTASTKKLITAIAPSANQQPNTIVVKKAVKYYTNNHSCVLFEELQKHGTSLGRIRKEHGEASVVRYIAFAITDFINKINVFTKMTDYQVVDLAEEIMLNYGYLMFEEIFVFFDLCVKGEYGHIPNRMDAALIFEMLEKYLQSREEHFVSKEMQHSQYDRLADRMGKMTISKAIENFKKKR